jgi:hypothetical protein
VQKFKLFATGSAAALPTNAPKLIASMSAMIFFLSMIKLH